MLIVKPILDKETQKELGNICGVTFNADALAFSAYIDEEIFGFCQFTVNGSIATLTDVRTLKNDFEAAFIMSRGALNYIDLCGFHTARCSKNAGDLTLLRSIGFKEIENDLFEINLSEEFTGKCTHCN